MEESLEVVPGAMKQCNCDQQVPKYLELFAVHRIRNSTLMYYNTVVKSTMICLNVRFITVLFMLQLFYSPMRDPAAAQDLLNDAEKQAFFLMTNIRIVLVKFITPGGFDPELVTETLKRSFYFTVSDWDVLASCHCNGQASECDPEVSLGKNEFTVPTCIHHIRKWWPSWGQ